MNGMRALVVVHVSQTVTSDKKGCPTLTARLCLPNRLDEATELECCYNGMKGTELNRLNFEIEWPAAAQLELLHAMSANN